LRKRDFLLTAAVVTAASLHALKKIIIVGDGGYPEVDFKQACVNSQLSIKVVHLLSGFYLFVTERKWR